MKCRRFLLVLVSAVLVVSLLGCGLSDIFGSKKQPTATPAPTNTVALPEPTATTAAVEAAATKAEKGATVEVEEATAEPTEAEGEEEEAEPTAATVEEEGGSDLVVETSFENVDSYAAVMTISYRSVDEAEDQAAVMSITQEVDKPNDAERYAIEGTDEDGNPMAMEVITIGEDSWMSFGEGWMHSKADDTADMSASSEEFLMQGSEILDAIENPRLVQEGEVVNGIATNHYAWDETAIEELGSTGVASGEVWISQEDNILIKMVMHATGDIMGEDEDNIVDMTWEILSLNEPLSIQPPEGMSTEDMLPVMPGGEDSDSFVVSNDMAIYEIEATAEDVIAWYDETLEADGYTKASEDIMEGMASASYTKDEVTLNLWVTDSDTEGVVSVMLTKG